MLLDGSKSTTADQRQGDAGEFLATTCVSCVKEMPELAATYNKFSDRLETVAVAMSYDPPTYVVNFAQSRQLPFKAAIDNTGAVAQANT